MSRLKQESIENISQNFTPKKYVKNDDPYFYHNKKEGKVQCRRLDAQEIEVLVKNNNFAENWNEILVTDQFDPNLVKNCEFFGRITIGKLTASTLEKNDLKLPVGISNSTIVSCDIGDNVVIRDVHYLSHYIISNHCILFNLDEMITTNNARFGNGIIKEDETEDLRIWIEVCNENGGRKVLPFVNMITADAYLWSKYRHDKKLMTRFKEMTDSSFDKRRGYYGQIGSDTIIKNSMIIKNVNVGECAYIKGANKLKNLTILSSEKESSQIGEGVELVNGIVGYGSKIFYGSKAVRFVTGRNCQVKYGARLINSILGDNSTISCCEVLNNLLFPFHEQHHNNSFLIASTVFGQSNIAAGATIGSNHNSRGPDGELIAGRGFWPGLCTNFKHNSKFASYVLIAKGSYQYEMNILYPFSLVLLDKIESAINIMPAYWFMYNMYAVARNNDKFKRRDKREHKVQNIETDYLAPDTVSEILSAIERIYFLLGKYLSNRENSEVHDQSTLIKMGRYHIETQNQDDPVLLDKEAMNRYGAQILKPIKAVKEYQKISLYFAIKKLFQYFKFSKDSTFQELHLQIMTLSESRVYKEWMNIGGQIMPTAEVETLLSKVKSNEYKNWDDLHNGYDLLWDSYDEQNARYALEVIEVLYQKKIKEIDLTLWKEIFLKAIDITEEIYNRSLSSREKDYTSSFRKIAYDNEEEMKAVIGTIEDNEFLSNLKKETVNQNKIYKQILKTIK